ncbi:MULTISPECIES: hypothetical protein [Streptomyces]|uniref:hypothetical protein n=1 Tax=Streptomyces TaxID=1883 RepID=UPI00114CDEC3|nr:MULTISPECIES: hypothetical protein [unclassified Streptomyces]MYR93400.1 hypothetical protein [Streptomyces sp. SID4937]
MTPVAVAAVMSMSLTTLILCALVLTMVGRMLPPKPSALLAAERRAQYRSMEPEAPHDHPSYGGGGYGFRPPPPPREH